MGGGGGGSFIDGTGNNGDHSGFTMTTFVINGNAGEVLCGIGCSLADYLQTRGLGKSDSVAFVRTGHGEGKLITVHPEAEKFDAVKAIAMLKAEFGDDMPIACMDNCFGYLHKNGIPLTKNSTEVKILAVVGGIAIIIGAAIIVLPAAAGGGSAATATMTGIEAQRIYTMYTAAAIALYDAAIVANRLADLLRQYVIQDRPNLGSVEPAAAQDRGGAAQPAIGRTRNWLAHPKR